MRLSFSILAACLVVAVAFTARAATPTPTVIITVYGVGQQSCGAYLEARRTRPNANDLRFTDWFGGYVSAMNFERFRGDGILGGTDMDGAFYWLDNYCRTHSTLAFFNGAQAFVKERAGQVH